MAYTNEQLLQKLDQAFKSVVDVNALGDSILVTQKFDRFVEAMQHRTNILPEARFQEMTSRKTEIDRIGFVDRVLTKGIKDDGSSETEKGSESFVKPDTWTNKLIAQELRGKVALTDRALRRNIERGDFENHLVNLFGEAAGRDFEEWALLSNTENLTEAGILEMTDGWLKLADKHIFGKGDDNDFDPDDAESILGALLDALPKQYLVNRSEWRFYVPYEIEDGYRNILKQRGTALGDSAQTAGERLYYKGIPVVYAPMLERSVAPDASGGEKGLGGVATLQHPDNMVWGVFHEVTIEPCRNAEERRTEFYLTIECDAHYEDEKAAVTAYLDKEELD